MRTVAGSTCRSVTTDRWFGEWGSPRMNAEELLLLTDELWLGCSESADYHRAVPEVRDVWLQATKVLGLIRRRATMQGRSIIAFVGATNVGKSTLLNRLLGEELETC
ncbi:MAG: 50S ribosome-binding GTPase [Planctomycetia bacterium]|nr:50S ribosome-binding GTPase [Planctomycetia bacterium]